MECWTTHSIYLAGIFHLSVFFFAIHFCTTMKEEQKNLFSLIWKCFGGEYWMRHLLKIFHKMKLKIERKSWKRKKKLCGFWEFSSIKPKYFVCVCVVCTLCVFDGRLEYSSPSFCLNLIYELNSYLYTPSIAHPHATEALFVVQISSKYVPRVEFKIFFFSFRNILIAHCSLIHTNLIHLQWMRKEMAKKETQLNKRVCVYAYECLICVYFFCGFFVSFAKNIFYRELFSFFPSLALVISHLFFPFCEVAHFHPLRFRFLFVPVQVGEWIERRKEKKKNVFLTLILSKQ